ncbi:hypothetical protein [Butyrivibrio proteoclasticus]|uniref:hypothetical protein n=1 Tax=Butyrivibrio proteoclasticus TaxID=43305 RepID=UPI00047AAB7A|nr:hypothetical protein [Butyrivibrio proteoclasticus]
MKKLFNIEMAGNCKKLLGASLVLSLAFATTVGATGTTTDSIKSRGNIEYDADKDGEPEVLFYSEDLTTISTGIDSLNQQISVLSSSFDTLTDTTSQYKSDIISGLNSNVYAKANIPADASFTDLINYINNIPAPTTAVGNFYNGGDNSGLGVGISSSNPTADVNVDGVTTINIGVNESITLPSGYYPNDITIQNNVANRGSNNVLLSTNSNSATLPAGYYDEFTVSTDIKNAGGTVAYCQHVHSTESADEYVVLDTVDPTSEGLANSYISPEATGCFTTPYYVTVVDSREQHGSSDCTQSGGSWQRGERHYKCNKCGWSGTGENGSHVYEKTHQELRGYTRSCGKTQGQIVKAIITY